jgi:hypothetical protein
VAKDYHAQKINKSFDYFMVHHYIDFATICFDLEQK